MNTNQFDQEQFDILDMVTIFSLCLDIDNRFENNKANRHQKHVEQEIDDIHDKVNRILKLLEEE